MLDFYAVAIIEILKFEKSDAKNLLSTIIIGVKAIVDSQCFSDGHRELPRWSVDPNFFQADEDEGLEQGGVRCVLPSHVEKPRDFVQSCHYHGVCAVGC